MTIGESFFKLFHMLVVVVLVILCMEMKPALGSFTSSRVGDHGKVKCIEKEKQALLEFKRGLIDDYGLLSSWGSEEEEKKDCCKWRGVRCSNRTGHVMVLDLRASSLPWDIDYQPLGGNISPSLLELQHLKYLDLSSNDFEESHIPEFIGSFSKLQYLNLSNSNFLGTVPNQIGNLSELRSLDLSYNYNAFLFQVPDVKNLKWLSHLSLLRYLDLSFVNLTKAKDWTEAINALPLLTDLHLFSCALHRIISPSLPWINSSASLAVLDLAGNSLTSSIYTWLFNFNTSLVYVDLSRNNLHGLIPRVIGSLNSLAHLDLSHNHLQGGIPKSFGNLTSLRTLYLSANELTGQISEFIQILSCGAEKSLEVLDLAMNQLGSSLPNNISTFSSLRVLYLADNHLSGSLPDFTGLSSLTKLKLAFNRFTGPLPKSIGQLFMLKTLDVSLNSLEGTISEAHLSNLNNLHELDLSHNSLALDFRYDWKPPFQLDVIMLQSCQLGPRFPNWLRTQNNYSNLDISGAQIFDTIPKWFWDLSPRLNYLNLSYNHITGVVPNLSSKVVYYPRIDLSSNHFKCPIPLFPPNVTSLHLSKNMFSGSISFLCDITSDFLSSIDLSDNQLSGKLPDCWMHMPELVILNLANNNFSGKIPSSLGFLYQVQTLHLRNNSFIGEFPSSLKNCKELRIIDMGENKLIGKIPAWIGTYLTNLIVLSLRLNKFHGHLPVSICHLSSIQILDLSQNDISGIIPQCFNNFTALVSRNKSEGNIAYTFLAYGGFTYYISGQYVDSAMVLWKGQEFEYKNTLGLIGSIDLSSNRFIGKIPEEISSLAELVSLNLSRNYFTGHVIQKIGVLKMLESLDLSRNRLSGEIPTGLTRLNFLSVLDLSNNNLSGRIPSSTQLQSFDASAYAGNHELCGLPLPNKCPGDETAIDPSISNRGKDNIIQEDGDWFINREFYISMGLGFGVAFGGVFGTLLLKRSWEYAYFKFLINIRDWLYVTTTVNMAKLRRQLQC